LGSFLIPALALHRGNTFPQTATDKTALQIKCCLLDITLFFEEPVIFFEAEKRVIFSALSLTGSRETAMKQRFFFTSNPFCHVAFHETLDATGSFQAEGLKNKLIQWSFHQTRRPSLPTEGSSTPFIRCQISHNIIIAFGRISSILRGK